MKNPHYFQKIFLILIAALLLFNFWSCNSDSPASGDSAASDNFILESDFTVTISELAGVTINDVYAFGNQVYLISDDNCFTYDLSDKTISDYPVGGSSICVDNACIYVCSTATRSLNIYSTADFSETATHTLDIPKESLQKINRMLLFGKTIIFEALYLNSSGYTESYVFEYNTEKLTLTDHTAYFKSKDSYSLLITMDKKSADTLIFVSIANTSFTNTIIKSYTYNFKKQTVQEEFIFNFDLTSCAYDAESDYYFYSLDSYTLKRYIRSDDANTTITKFNEEIGDSLSIDRFFIYNGWLFIYKNSSNVLSAVNTAMTEDSIHILAYDSVQLWFDLDNIAEQFQRRYGKNVYITFYKSKIFKDILRTKLLSKSDDFDIVFVDNPAESNFLASLIKYKLYAPLNENEQINKNFEEMYPGVPDMVRFDDFVIGIPYYFDISNLLARENDAPVLPGFDITISDIWSACEQISPDDNITLFSDHYMMVRFLTETVQDQILSDNLSADEIESLLTNIKKNYDSGKLFSTDINGNYLEGKTHVFRVGPMFFYRFLIAPGEDDIVFPEYGVAGYPYPEKRHINLRGLALLNKYSANLDLAYDFFALMTESDNIYSTGLQEIYQTLLGKQLERNPMYSKWTQDDIAYLSVLPQLFENSVVYTFDCNLFGDYIRENIMTDFFTGKLSPKDAAKEIVTFVEYTYFE